MTGCIVGWAHTKFGKLEGADAESLIVQVARDAVADAGIAPGDVDAVYVGFYNGGFSKQDFAASLVLQAHDDFRFKPVTRVENACATGSAAIHQGLNYLEAKRGRIVLAVGVEKMTDTPGPEIGGILMKASYLKEEAEIEGGFAGVFGRIAQQYFQKYGDQTDALARIASKNHKNGCANPWAQMQKDLSVETETALAMKKAVVFRARNHVNEFLPMSRRDMTFLDGAAKAWEGALAEGRLSLDDLSLVETHDCFTIAELLEYEAMGLTPKGQGARAITEGWTQKDGKLPVNASGGLKAKGHPIGATGVSMHIMAAMQARGEAGGMQVKGAKLAGVFNMGGAGVANYVSILEALR
jgi:acetyl-CoA C-acetyltransferase